MAGGYIDVPIETNPDTLTAAALAELMAAIPGWVPREGHLEVALIEVLGRMTAEAADVASRVPRSIFRFFGGLVALPAIGPTSATVASTWTMADTQGYTIPAGTVVAFRTAGDVLVPFRTAAAATVSPGSATTLAGSVLLTATVLGSASNDLTGAMVLVDSLAFVAAVSATTVSSGGVDGETDDEYLDRLSQELELLAPRPILANDFAVLARRVAGVHRALALDGYDPATATFGNERMVALAVVSQTGTALTTGTKQAVDDYLEARREVNFVINIIDPIYTAVAVAVTVKRLATFEAATLKAAVEAAVLAYLAPGSWGGGDLDPPEWRASANIVRYLEMASLIDGVPGVDYIASLTINGGTSDVALAGAAPLPSVASTAAATVI